MAAPLSRPPPVAGRRTGQHLIEIAHGVFRLMHHARIVELPPVRLAWRRAIRPLCLRISPNLAFAALGVDEQFESRLFQSLVRPGDVVVDVGANVGYYTVLAARAVGPTGHVYAFEPEPANFARLRATIRAFRYQHVTLVAQAVSDSDEPARLYLAPDSMPGDHRIVDPGDGRRFISVGALRLDDYFASATPSPRVDAIKMDIQGAEMRALDGMDATLSRNHDVKLFTEFWPIGLHRAGVDPRAYLDRLASYGFQVYEIDNEAGSLASLRTDELLTRYTPANRRYTNLLCLREPPASLAPLLRT
jgi:FkbM family methyltransferase